MQGQNSDNVALPTCFTLRENKGLNSLKKQVWFPASTSTSDFAFIITKEQHKLPRLLSKKIFLVHLFMARRCQIQDPTTDIQIVFNVHASVLEFQLFFLYQSFFCLN